jgi:hypothetical protein
MPLPGEIYRHDRYYQNAQGGWEAKYFVVLAFTPGRDVVHRALTSRRNGRPEAPPCYHGDPYPGYYLGVLGTPLTRPTWVDLRAADDYDRDDFDADLATGALPLIMTLRLPVLCEVLACTASAEDTTKQQHQALLDQKAQLACP